MQNRARIKQRLTLRLLILLLCGGALSLAAQQDLPKQPAKEAATAASQTGKEILAAPPDADATISPDPATTEEDPDSAPFDYQSSEKISEDLSVSFPVDI